VPELQRAEVLAALRAVDGVVIFDNPTATGLIEALKPDVYVKGGDYRLETLPEAPVVLGCGGRIELVEVEIATSTTAIVNRILNQAPLG
jgi:bifunctional ADP-heptose synthase (sugar kinase/adenylyltransferase)